LGIPDRLLHIINGWEEPAETINPPISS